MKHVMLQKEGDIHMRSKELVFLLNKYENQILELVYTQDAFTTSDLQGAIGAIVYNIYVAGTKAKEQQV